MGTSATASPAGRRADAGPGRASPAMLRAARGPGRPGVAPHRPIWPGLSWRSGWSGPARPLCSSNSKRPRRA